MKTGENRLRNGERVSRRRTTASARYLRKRGGDFQLSSKGRLKRGKGLVSTFINKSELDRKSNDHGIKASVSRINE